MNRLFFAPLAVLLLAGCSKAPYKILDRSSDSMGLVVTIRAEVPADATREQIESWCGAINDGEKGDVLTNIEFIEDGPLIRQKAFCTAGKVTMISDLEKRAAG
ncbi:hypothetical protein IAD21_01420 [Abditibacteriota bacterium]|nr:hypothetical protein IAD21_01420 [Abditibacteriota bacterium]